MVEKLKRSNNLDVIAELENSDAGSATGSEALISTGKLYLSTLKHNKLSINELLEKRSTSISTIVKRMDLL